MNGPERTVLFVYTSGMSARLRGTGTFRGQEWRLGAGTFTIGRDATNALPLPDVAGVSKVHCKITMENGAFLVEDAESRNGTLVNGKAVRKATLVNGDSVQVCSAVFIFEQQGAPNAAPPAQPEPTVKTAVPLPAVPLPAGPAPTAEPTRATVTVPLVVPRATQPSSGAPFFVLGMLVFFGVAGAGLVALDVVQLTPSAVEAPAPPVATDLPTPVAPPAVPVAQEATSLAAPPAVVAKGNAAGSSGPPAVAVAPTDPAPVVAVPKAAELAGVLVVKGAGPARVEVAHQQDRKVGMVTVKEGSRVKRGQVLFLYEDADASRRLATQRELFNQLKEVAAASNSPRAQKELDSAKAEMDQAAQQVASLRVLSPRDATVVSVAAQPGQRGQKGQVALVLGTEGATAVRVTAAVPAEHQARFSKGSPASVKVGGTPADAVVERLDRGTVTLLLRAPPNGIHDGDAVTVMVP